MTGQHFVFLETISGMKRALSRSDYASDSDNSVGKPTNRANKLKKKSRHAQQGRLDINYSLRAQRRKIEHAGFKRAIVSRNPPRYDYDGDELPDYEDDDSVDASPVEENPYKDIKLDQLLAPLTSAADLPTHPSLSNPYYSKSITEMARKAEESLQRERAYLHRVKRLLTRFRGDEEWAPCGIMNSDMDILAPPEANKAGANGTQLVNGSGSSKAVQETEQSDRSVVAKGANERDIDLGDSCSFKKSDKRQLEVPSANMTVDEREKRAVDGKELIDTERDFHTSNDAKVNGTDQEQRLTNAQWDKMNSSKVEKDVVPEHDVSLNQQTKQNESDSRAENQNQAPNPDDTLPSPTVEDDLDPTAVAPRRVVTRAQTHAKSKTSSPSLPNASPLPYSNNSIVAGEAEVDLLPSVHPLFLIPSSAIPDRNVGLPSPQADELRRQLLLWVQKQEEVVRGIQKLCFGLLKADRMRHDVLSWTKAEGHLHEMSDGEDWYDREEWALEEELVKGKEEEEDEAGGVTAKKTRQRRAER